MRHWILVLLAAAACAIVSGLSITAVIILDPTRDPSVPSNVIMLTTPTWLEVLLFAEPVAVLAGAAFLVRKRLGKVVGMIAACLALASVPCLLFVTWAALLWVGCSGISCDDSNAAIQELARAPKLVGDLMLYAGAISLVAIPLSLTATVWSLVAALRGPMPHHVST